MNTKFIAFYKSYKELSLNNKRVVIVDFNFVYDQTTVDGGVYDAVLHYKKHKTLPSLKEYYSVKLNENTYVIPSGGELVDFDWDKFYEEEDGKNLIYRLRETIKFDFENPDYVLIISPSIPSPVSSICCLILADVVYVTSTEDYGLISEAVEKYKSNVKVVDKLTEIEYT